MRSLKAILIATVLASISSLACSGSDGTLGQPTAPPLNTAPDANSSGAIESTWEEAAELVGFQLAEPEYLPDGLIPNPNASVSVENGLAVSVFFGYDGETGLESIPFVTIDQRNGSSDCLNAVGREVAIDQVPVYISSGEGLVAGGNLAQACWSDNGFSFQLSVIGSLEIERLEEEAVKIADSMIR